MLPSSQMAIQLTLLLISCSLYSMYSSSSSSSSSSSFSTSSSLALLVLVISTCLSLLFSNFRQLIKASGHKAKPLPPMEDEPVHREKNTVAQDGVVEEAPEDLPGDSPESSDCLAREECADEGPVYDDDNDDDESLIEISLVDGHYMGQQREQCEWREQELLAEFLPDMVLDGRDFFMDILSEIGEEDNLIEIDITRGSVKCPNFSIKA